MVYIYVYITSETVSKGSGVRVMVVTAFAGSAVIRASAAKKPLGGLCSVCIANDVNRAVGSTSYYKN